MDDGTWTLADTLWGALSGLIGVLAIVLLYACLALGPMSILSPLAAVVSAIAPMLWGLIVGGESLGPLGYVGLGTALVAVVLVGFIPGEKVVRLVDLAHPAGADERDDFVRTEVRPWSQQECGDLTNIRQTVRGRTR